MQTLPGIGPLRAAHVIQLSALLGLIPIHLYIYILPNFKAKKGPTIFFSEKMNWDKSCFETKYIEELFKLQQLYSMNFTSNMLENTSCIIGRSTQKKDVMYHFPLFDTKLSLSTNKSMIQFVFRVKVLDIRNICLLCKPSTTAKEFTVFDTTTSQRKSKTIICFNRTENRDDTSTSYISNNNHSFDKDYLVQFLTDNNMVQMSESNNMFFDPLKLPRFKNHYSITQQINNYDSWNQFSVIHNTPGNKFNFIVYNASHQLKNKEIVNPQTKVEIMFPKIGSYFIVFHGRLVHSGGSSIKSSDGQVEKSSRLFSYLSVPLHNVIPRSSRRSKRLTNYTTNIRENTVDTNSFQFDIKSLQRDLPVYTIKLPEHSDNNITNCPIPVAGNMIEHGWEVYKGIDYNKRVFKSFNQDISKLITDHASKFSKISQTNRSSFDISTLDARLNKSIMSLKALYRVFNDMLQTFLRKIPYLDEALQNKQIVLCNMGDVDEQIPHRDYSSVKK